ncbi:MAG: hypothetical protein QM640_03835, partial [Niabella sp.]
YDHIQDNKKVLRANGTDKLIVEEKGLNGYEKLPESECAEGKQYWEEHKGFWIALQREWDKLLDARSSVKLTEKVGDEDLMTKLFALADDWKAKKLTAADVNTTVAAVLARHIQ